MSICPLLVKCDRGSIRTRRKGTTNLLLLALLLLFPSGCAPSAKHLRYVMVSVVDSTTRAPVSGAKVSAVYPAPWATAQAPWRISEGLTDASGRSVLRPRYRSLSSTPVYRVFINNDAYRQDIVVAPNATIDMGLMARSPDVTPAIPDIEFAVASEAELAQRSAAHRLAPKPDKQKAGESRQHSSEFWPRSKEGPYSWPEDDAGRQLLSERWRAVSRVPLGTKEDIRSICAVVLRHSALPETSVDGIGWLSPTLVMVSAGWYRGPLAAASYTYVLQKEEQGWTLVVCYLHFIS